ncbi:MAG: aminopeptidase N [Oligoflexia bacterium]|nr:aminopeptidase N [Oligoflexia bacterium]
MIKKFLFFMLLSKSVFAQTLTQAEALKRTEAISNLHYKVDVSILKNTDEYTGAVDILFDLKKLTPLRIDFKEGQVIKLSINKNEVSDYIKKEEALFIPEKYLSLGEQSIHIEFTQKFNRQGIGLHKFTDPEDGENYFYTQFEANDASRFMPCFDQPDIKAKFSLKVTTEKNWKVISTNKETSVKNLDNNKNLWTFSETPIISTYVFSLHVGPYKEWKDKYKNIPLRLFARQSLSKYVDTKEWFTITKQGLKYFESYFNYPYPFEKYDQLIVPEFNFGAMENAGAVTFKEGFVSRGKQTKDQKEGTAEVILHEMAHMWFGNLVTMRWWNDLWLNESFATYMATKAVSESTEYKKAWMSFYLGDKNWAYYSDELSTTHPIEADVPTSDDAFNNFDGITYGKGASVMKQLAYYIGENNFKKGLEKYFKKHAYKNTTLDDLLNELEGEVKLTNNKINLQEWKKIWLQSKGVDTIESGFKCNSSKLSEISIKVKPSNYSKAKIHAFEVVSYKLTNNKLKLINNSQVALTDLASIKVGNVECPDFVFPNYNDYGYFKINLDLTTLSNIKKHVLKIEDSFLRVMVFNTMWQMVRDQNISLYEYLTFAKNNLSKEEDFKIINLVTKQLSGGGYNTTNNALYYHPIENRSDIFEKSKLRTKIEKLYLTMLDRAKPGSDFQKIWFESFLQVGQSPLAQQKMIDWLGGKWKIKGLEVDPDLRWKAITRLCYKDHFKALTLLNNELKKDSSDIAKKFSLNCMASFSKLDNKKKWWNEIVNENSSYSFTDKESILRGLFLEEQRQFIAPYFSIHYFETLKDTSVKRSEHFLSTFTELAGPDTCISDERKRYVDFINNNSELSPIILKHLKELVDDGGRCEKIRAKAGNIKAELF